MTGGMAIGCLSGGRSVTIPLPFFCINPTCQAQRDKAALDKAIERGVIDP